MAAASECKPEQEKHILIVGLVCLDIINTVDRFPKEDEDMRALSQRWQKGGNAANTAIVLSQTLGSVYTTSTSSACELLCSLNQSFEAQYVKEELRKRGVLIENCPVKENCGFPTSCAFVNCESGTRTIVHSRNSLPELSFEDFDKLELSSYDWIHFEGRRNVDEIIEMIRKIKAFKSSTNVEVVVSVELEKKREDLKKLLCLTDVLFIGKDFARFCGFSSAEEAVKEFYSQVNVVKPEVKVVCAWGEVGAFGMDSSGEIVSSCSYPPVKVVDTLGAGDTFNAGVIFSLRQGRTLKEALEFGCKIAGKKCGIHGFDGLSISEKE